MLRKCIAAASMVCVVAALVMSSGASAEEPAAGAPSPSTALAGECVANFVCIWSQINYEGSVEYMECARLGTYGTPGGNPYRSAKNRCGGKGVYLNTAASGNVCMNPGGDRPSPGYFTGVTFLNYGQTC